MIDPTSVPDALALLHTLDAPDCLIRHGQIVAEVATELSHEITRLGVEHDENLVVVGAALHDVGKIMHPEELTGPGTEHEAAGERLLLGEGLSTSLARVCRTHGAWTNTATDLEDRLIALADHIWKGTRNESLESSIALNVAHLLGIAPWAALLTLDPIFERISAKAELRLAAAQL